jgi:hypothetical protein
MHGNVTMAEREGCDFEHYLYDIASLCAPCWHAPEIEVLTELPAFDLLAKPPIEPAHKKHIFQARNNKNKTMNLIPQQSIRDHLRVGQTGTQKPPLQTPCRICK